MRLTLLIPVLNEISLIEKALSELMPPTDTEVLVVDGGSQDGTGKIAQKHCEEKGWKFVAASLPLPSVGRTVRAGIAEAKGETILVLPCDCRLKPEALMAWNGARCGGFAKRYGPSNWLLSFYAKLQNELRSKKGRNLVWTNGIFFPRGTRIPTDGFLEDVQLSDTLKIEVGWTFIDVPLEVSARRYYPNRVLRRIFLNFTILLLYRLGYSDLTRLRRLYLSLS